MAWNSSIDNCSTCTHETILTSSGVISSTDDYQQDSYATDVSSSTSSSEAEIEHEWSTLDDIYLALTSAILVVGSIGNMMVIGAVLSHK